METLRIRCRPTGLFIYPATFGTWVHLDSLMTRAVMLDRYGSEYYALPSISPNTPPDQLLEIPLPLERRLRNGIWYWACSWCDVAAASYSQAETGWIRGYPAKDAEHYLADKRRLLIKTWQGEDKLSNQPIYLHIVDELVWYAVGDAAAISHLLETYCPAIGKKTAYGQGQLAYYEDGRRWKVESWGDDWSERDSEGRLTRGVPVDMTAGFPLDMVMAPVRPPYYVWGNRTWVLMPGPQAQTAGEEFGNG